MTARINQNRPDQVQSAQAQSHQKAVQGYADHHVVVVAHYAHWLLNFRLPLLLALRSKASRVTVLVPNPSPQLKVELLSHGIDCFHYPLERTGLNPVSDMASLKALTRLLNQLHPTHVLTTAIKPNIYGSVAAHLAKVPRVFSLITGLGYAFMGQSPKRKLMSQVVTRLYKIAFFKNRSIIFQNKDDQNLFMERKIVKNSNSSVVNGSGVDLTKFTSVPMPSQAEIVFLMISRIVREKGVVEYVEAAKQLRKLNVPARIILAGPLDDNPSALSDAEFKSLIRDAGIEYYGELKDVRPALNECQVFVLPSYREGTPRSTLEALATGRAVITTDAPGCRETVVDGVNGFMVPVANSLALAEAMHKLIQNPEQLHDMGAASLQMAQTKFDIIQVNEKMLDIIFANSENQNPADQGHL